MTSHVIRQQHLEVDFDGTEADAQALQRTLSPLCRNWMAPAMEAILERCAPPDTQLVIDRLEIDAGSLPMEDLARDLARSVAAALEKSLREQIRLLSSSGSAVEGVRERSREGGINEAFNHFLSTGTLPWWFRLPPGQSLEQVVLQSWQDDAASGSISAADSVLRALASPSARERLVRQFSSLLLDTLLATLSPQQHKSLQEVVETVRKAPSPPSPRSLLYRTLWEISFASVSAGTPRRAEELVSALFPALPISDQRGEVGTDLKRRWPMATENRTRPISPSEPDSVEGGKRTGSIHAADGKTKEEVPVRNSFSSIEAEAEEGIFIDNAGVVLLHPFLPLFFETVGLAAEGKILQPARALCLLHYLVTGQSFAPEYELLLLKILCGIAPDLPVYPDVGLTEAERAEAEELLRSVIGHWDALGNTSSDALRGTFLLRPGKLTLRDGDWLLQVEPQSFDILLEQLPWGVSLVKLPWMERICWVEWR